MTTAIPGTLGKVMSCTSDLSVVPKYVTGNRRVIEALYRRFTTSRGDLFYDPNYGKNVLDYLQDTMTPELLAQIPGDLTAEAEKDPRVSQVRLTATYTAASKTLAIVLVGLGPEGLFAATLTANTSTGVSLL